MGASNRRHADGYAGSVALRVDGRAGRPSRFAFGILGLALASAALIAASCASTGATRSTGPTAEASPTPVSGANPPATSTGDASRAASPEADLARARVRLREVAALKQPLAIAVRPDDPALYVAEKVGRVVAVEDGAEPRTVLNLVGQVSLGTEQGLLGLAFSPNGRFLYVNFTDTNGDTRVTEFAFDQDGADPASRRNVLFVAQPFSNHNGGALAFGPDGYLYVALGDGGGGGDPFSNGQSLSTPLGKILRISPRPSRGRPYGIPPDNPFVDTPDARPEIWDYGLRNPWRFSFDRETGDLWIGDVGQSTVEEVDVDPSGSGGGLNYGWNLFEGSQPFAGDNRAGLTMPIYEYPSAEANCSVTGGYVYRGSAIPDLVGAYVFGDYCRGSLEAFVPRQGRATGHRFLGPHVDGLASFGEDAAGELYVCSLAGQVFRLVPGEG
jgi:glucose/arabinose dehydrogenase